MFFKSDGKTKSRKAERRRKDAWNSHYHLDKTDWRKSDYNHVSYRRDQTSPGALCGIDQAQKQASLHASQRLSLWALHERRRSEVPGVIYSSSALLKTKHRGWASIKIFMKLSTMIYHSAWHAWKFWWERKMRGASRSEEFFGKKIKRKKSGGENHGNEKICMRQHRGSCHKPNHWDNVVLPLGDSPGCSHLYRQRHI